MTEPTRWRGVRPAPLVAWSVAGLSAVATVFAIGVHPGAGIPWDAVALPVLFGVPGALIARELPRHPVGWLLLLIGGCFAATGLALQWLASGHEGGAAWVGWWAQRGSALLVPALLLLLLLLPDGHLPSPGWRPITRLAVGTQAAVILLGWLTPGLLDPSEKPVRGLEGLRNPLGVLPGSWTSTVEASVDPVLTLPLLLGIGAVVRRVRRPEGDERPRAVSVLAGVAVFVLLVTVPGAVFPAGREWFNIAGATVLSGVILTAVVRGRFERARVVVSHALVYSVLSIGVLLVYVALVAGSTQVGAPEGVAGILTALVALGLLPVRGLLQAGLRRAMYGDRGEPQRALRRLSTSVAGSDDLDDLLRGLADSVRSSLRARWVQAEFRGCTSKTGSVAGSPTVDVVLEGGDGDAGMLRVGLAPGRSLSLDEQELLRDLAEHGARAARVVCLARDLRAARQTLVEGREQDRSRLRQELHDDLGPILAGLAMQLGSLPDVLAADVALATQRLCRLEAQALEALERTRQISRDLRPPTLDELGLVGAVVQAGHALGMRVEVSGESPERLSPAVEVAAYRIGVEALVNAQRHARVDEVSLRFQHDQGHLTLEVIDCGGGMGSALPGVGLRSMQDRVSELGGTIEFMETPGGGVTVRASIPVSPERANLA